MNDKWNLYVITDTGQEVPHFGASTRRRIREEVKSLRAQAHPRKIKIKIKKGIPNDH